MQLPGDFQQVLTALGQVARPRLAGGCVRDSLLGLTPKDYDIEVQGIGFDKLHATLAPFGATDIVGRSFGVIKLRLGSGDYDFSLPRRESKTGSGHRGFAVTPDPLLSDADADWQGMPAGSVIGHVHLQVGAIPEAESFYTGVLGMTLKTRYPGGSFYASGDYHHHLATNIWNSRGAKPLVGGETGLAEVVLRATKAEHDAIAARTGQTGDVLTLADPWNIPLTITTKDETHAG